MRSDIVSNFETYLMALLGGVLIGVGSAVATAATGRIPGVSGVLGRLLRPSAGDLSWRILFLIALIGGAATAFGLVTSASAFSFVRPLWIVVPAGLLVGFGTRLCGGCTSGHGVCGIGLGAGDSLLATAIFVAAGILTVLGSHFL